MDIGIIGLGRLGGSLQRALSEVAGVTVRTGPAAERAGLVLLCVPDDAIAEVAAKLEPVPGAVVAHCSGVLPAAVLDVAPAAAASFHPLQTFPDAETGASRFLDCPVFIEGDPAALERLESLAERLGAVPHRLSAAAKVRYHAAAVMACNHVCALLDAAFEVAGEAGVADPTVYLPLVRATLENVERLGPAGALTGPVARGDTQTVAHHLQALSANAELRELYRILSMRALEMTDRPEKTNTSMRDLLRDQN